MQRCTKEKSTKSGKINEGPSTEVAHINEMDLDTSNIKKKKRNLHTNPLHNLTEVLRGHGILFTWGVASVLVKDVCCY
ncbi:hypothetical protein HJC23_011005 [Cyclotella cryptica]|uniref:LAGLIDADG homing endonuclease n=1 Tax=Cyclotella cryptica TaxID=29204 RepID=A0ABD3PYQ1_9STRA